MINKTTLMLFGDMPREVADPKRKVIHSLSEFARFIERNNGRRNCYTSVYPLTGVIDKIFWDLDGPQALEDAKKIYGWFKNEGCVSVPVASGKKGFHIYSLLKPQKYGAKEGLAGSEVELKSEEGVNPTTPSAKSLLMAVTYSILYTIFGDSDKTSVSVDPHCIGDVRRICRIPNTLRPPENLNYCTYLPPRGFLDMTEEDVALHIKSTHSYDYDFDGKLPLLTDFDVPEDLKFDKWAPIGNETPIHPTGKGDRFLKGVLRPCLYRHMISKEPKHAVRVASTVDLLQEGFSPSDIFKIYSRLGWGDFDPGVTKYQIESCRHLKPYSCRKLRRLGIPMVCCVG